MRPAPTHFRWQRLGRRLPAALILVLLLAFSARAFVPRSVFASVSVVSGGFNATEGTAFSGVVATFNDTDAGCAGTLTATINWGDTTSSAGTVDIGACPTVTVSGTHTYAEEGSFTYSVTLSGGSNDAVLVTSATVADAPLGFLFASLSGNATPGVLVSFSAGFTDGNPAGLVSDFSATINWGDGTTTLGSVNAGIGSFGVTGSHVYTTTGAFMVTATVNDIGGSTLILLAGSAVIVPAQTGNFPAQTFHSPPYSGANFDPRCSFGCGPVGLP